MIATGSFASFVQSAASGCWLLGAPLGVVAPVIGAGVGVAIAAATVAEHANSDEMGDPHATDATDDKQKVYVVIAHRWTRTAVWRFHTLSSAREHFKNGGKMRRMLVKLGKEPLVNDHGRVVHWEELKFAGRNPSVDNAMRDHLDALV